MKLLKFYLLFLLSQVACLWGYEPMRELIDAGSDGGTEDSGNQFGWALVSAGNKHTCAIHLNGSLYCWGDNQFGQLGLGHNVSQSTPVKIEYNGTWQEISLGINYTCGLNQNGALFCWGENQGGQCGYPTIGTDYFNYPHQEALKKKWRKVSTGGGHTCATDMDSGLYCWGLNDDGQLGIGNTENQLEPVPIDFDDVSTQVDKALTTGEFLTCAMNSDQLLFCWGSNSRGQLGVGSNSELFMTVPTPVSQEQVGQWKYVSAGSEHTCAISKNTETLFCWGRNEEGQLGIGTKDEPNTPNTAVSPDLTWRMVSTGYRFTCGLTGDKLFCWGSNSNQQLAQEKMIIEATDPIIVLGDIKWKSVSTGDRHACAITTANILHCWGENSYGQLGLGIISDSELPLEIPLPPTIGAKISSNLFD